MICPGLVTGKVRNSGSTSFALAKFCTRDTRTEVRVSRNKDIPSQGRGYQESVISQLGYQGTCRKTQYNIYNNPRHAAHRLRTRPRQIPSINQVQHSQSHQSNQSTPHHQSHQMSNQSNQSSPRGCPTDITGGVGIAGWRSPESPSAMPRRGIGTEIGGKD